MLQKKAKMEVRRSQRRGLDEKNAKKSGQAGARMTTRDLEQIAIFSKTTISASQGHRALQDAERAARAAL